MNREEGAGTVMAVTVIAVIVSVVVLLAPVAVVLEARHRAEAAADSAALAAADTALGLATGTPCTRAGEVVAAVAGPVLVSCRQRGDLVRVEVRADPLGLPVTAVAVAGPPPGDP